MVWSTYVSGPLDFWAPKKGLISSLDWRNPPSPLHGQIRIFSEVNKIKTSPSRYECLNGRHHIILSKREVKTDQLTLIWQTDIYSATITILTSNS